jgi:soluble lytic murein transglycosylase-like protein
MSRWTGRRPSRRLWRVLISALAGGGISAVGLGGPLAGDVLGAQPSGQSANTETVPLGVSESAPPPESTGQRSGTKTTTTPTITTTTPAQKSTPPTTTEKLVVTPAPEPAPKKSEAPAVAVQRKQKATTAAPATTPATTATTPGTPGAAAGANNVAPAPQLVAAQAGVLAAELAGSAASVQALSFYRIPLFLLPIYQAASAQYGVPWQILAAINEIETDYGNDLSVSTAGAVGWMQFMPATWIQYGVDALNAGYADPYNPVDAIFAAARYLRAAGASSNLRAAILAYNHSAEYVSSVLLRAKLISSYPNPVISTLTGLTDGRLPVRNGQLAWDSIARLISPSSATAQAQPLGAGEAPGEARSARTGAHAPSPLAAAASRRHAAAQPLQLADLVTSANATVVAVQDGRIEKLGSSRALGRYVVLRDVYGDVFTYAGLGSVASSFRQPSAPRVAGVSAAALAASSALAPAGGKANHLPITLHVKSPPRRSPDASAPGTGAASTTLAATAPAVGKVRLFAHPGNVDALALQASAAAKPSHGSLPLRVGSIVSKGTVLGHANTPKGASAGHLRFAIRPAGDLNTVDPRPILQNWSQLRAALHPQGVRGETDLLGATASGVFLLSKNDLERDVLADPGITLPGCAHEAISSGSIDRRVLAVLAYLSRSGLKPTVAALHCRVAYTSSGLPAPRFAANAVDISAIDGIPIAGHQGPGTVTDVVIRTLLALRGEFAPLHVVSLMHFPGVAGTLASAESWDRIHIAFRPLAAAAQPSPAAAALSASAHSARKGAVAPSPLLVGGDLNSTQWSQLFGQIGSLHAPSVPVKKSSAAIPDQPQHP